MILWCKVLSFPAFLWHRICTREPKNMAVLHIKSLLEVIAFIMLEGGEIDTELHWVIC